MKKVLFFLSIALLTACSGPVKETSETAAAPVPTTDVKGLSFDELFKSIAPEDIPENILKLVGKDYTVIVAGDSTDYNAMVASDGGMGRLIGKPVTFCGLRASRYTLEIILKDHKYTMTYFEEQYKDEFMKFGDKSGRDSDKMKASTLTPVATPSGRMTFKEAKLVIECQLAQTLTVDPKTAFAEDNKKFITDAFAEVGGYHQIVFGDITNVWMRK